jgi:hypothetical protein
MTSCRTMNKKKVKKKEKSRLYGKNKFLF